MNASHLSERGRRIYAGMAASGITSAADLARRIKVSRQTVSRWLTQPDAMPSAAEAFRLADTLHMSARWLVTGDGHATPREQIAPNERRLLCRYRKLDERRRTILLHAAADLLTT